jgi:GNAT superfamily N-acetyltransferase
MHAPDISLRPATSGDLPAVNAVVERAIMSWNLPERVKRLALPVYRYSDLDLAVMGSVLAVGPEGAVVGFAAWEPADPSDIPDGTTALLLHGLYVDPARHGRGIGTRLLEAAEQAAREQLMNGLLIRAQRAAESFFLRRGLQALPAANGRRHHANRLWKPLRSATDV